MEATENRYKSPAVHDMFLSFMFLDSHTNQWKASVEGMHPHFNTDMQFASQQCIIDIVVKMKVEEEAISQSAISAISTKVNRDRWELQRGI